jgi:polysaccharide biosynthesis protein PslH
VLEAIDDVERLNRLQERAYAACSGRFDWASRGRQILSAIARPLGAAT